MSPAKQDHTPINTFPRSGPLRHEWTQAYPAGWHELVILTLDERGMISDCSKTGEILFGYSRNDLVCQPVSRLFPQLLEVALFQEGRFNPLLKYLCRCGHLFQSQNRQGDTFLSELSFVQLGHPWTGALRVIVRHSGAAQA